MRKNILWVLSGLFLFAMCGKVKSLLQIQHAFPNLTVEMPVDIENASAGSNRLFVVEQQGIISVFPNDSSSTNNKIFLGISSKVLGDGELGLLGLAFHPDFRNNGFWTG